MSASAFNCHATSSIGGRREVVFGGAAAVPVACFTIGRSRLPRPSCENGTTLNALGSRSKLTVSDLPSGSTTVILTACGLPLDCESHVHFAPTEAQDGSSF